MSARILDTQSLAKIIRKSILLLALLGPLLVMYGIWDPVLRAFSIKDVEISNEVVNASKRYPERRVAESMVKYGNIFPDPLNDNERKNLISVATRLLRGTLILEKYPQHLVSPTFRQEYVFAGQSDWQLAYSSFLIPRILLDAYRRSYNEEFLLAALTFVLDWEQFEKGTWSPESFVWNDHAVATRSKVLADVWYHYKSHPAFSLETGRRLLQMATRDATFLARDLNYTFKTNHGAMQSLAILKAVLFFPEIDKLQGLKSGAVNNLLEQYRFFIHPEGVVLEHSAGYHAFGLTLVAETFEFFSFLNIPIPEDLENKYQLGLLFLKALRRPDGDLPRLGDTGEPFDLHGLYLVDEGGQKLAQPDQEKEHWRPASDIAFKPRAGYAIWWSGLAAWPEEKMLSQTAITWSYFPFMGHKHADELSFNLWNGGQEWWSSVGYWPYTDRRRLAAISWTGSNAPHYIGEARNSERRSYVRAIANDDRVKVIDLVRQGADGFEVRRQIINVRDTIWIALDSFQDPMKRRARVVWGLHSTLQSSQESMNRFRVFRSGLSKEMNVFFKGSKGMEIRKTRSATQPMAGWQAFGQQVLPADAFVVTQTADRGWLGVVSIFGTGDHLARASNSAEIDWNNPEEWAVDIVIGKSTLQVSRAGDFVYVGDLGAAKNPGPVALQSLDISQQQQTDITNAYYAAEENHGKRFLPLIKYRERATVYIAILFLINAFALYILRKRFWSAPSVSIMSFGLFYYWLANYYFIV